MVVSAAEAKTGSGRPDATEDRRMNLSSRSRVAGLDAASGVDLEPPVTAGRRGDGLNVGSNPTAATPVTAEVLHATAIAGSIPAVSIGT
jgi:hypothetical protein